MKRRISPIAVLLLLVMVATLGVTRRDYSKRNLRVFWGMVTTPSLKPQSANTVFADGLTNQAPVPGTIPRGDPPYPYRNTPDGRQLSGFRLQNPFERSPEVLARGKEVFETYCSHCHGKRGYGDGPVAQRSLLTMSLHGTVTKERRDGGIFHIITYGRLYMPAHGPLIEADDRWKAIHYVRALQERDTESRQ